MAQDAPLFSAGELRNYLANRSQEAKQAVDAIPETDLLALDGGQAANDLRQRFSVQPAHLGDPHFEDLGETTIDLTHSGRDFMRWGERRVLAPGFRVRIHVPVESGDVALFRLKPSTWSTTSPTGSIENGFVSHTLTVRASEAIDLDARAADFVHSLNRHLEWGLADVEAHNERLGDLIPAWIEGRRERCLARRDLFARSALPVRERADAPRTYQAPGLSQRPSPARPLGAKKPVAPLDPVLIGDFYEHILSVIRAGGRGIERARRSFSGLDEESLRQLFLFTLNTHYAGNAVGEAFNAEGKTDILVRVADRNVFIGECKFWKGPAGLRDTIDQVFRYTTWQDTKVALIVFVTQKALTPVIDKGRSELAAHAQFQAWQPAPEGELRCRMSWPGDAGRDVDLAVCFVHLATEA